MGTTQIALITDHSSTEGSRPCLVAAIEALTGRPPVLIDARPFVAGGGGGVIAEDGQIELRVPGEDIAVRPRVLIIYEIPPSLRRELEGFQRVLSEQGVRSLGTDANAWRAATEKNLTVERFGACGIRHRETITLSRPDRAQACLAFEHLGRDVWARPTVGMGGADVFHVTSEAELQRVARYYADRGLDWQVSRDANNFGENGLRHQFRVVVLDGRVIQACENVQQDPDKPCNESRGAVSTLLDVDDLPLELHDLAVSATKSLGLRFGGVDLALEEGGAVFEVNVHPAMTGPQRPLETMAIPYVQAHLEML